MPRALFDKYAKKALYAYGEYKALGMGAGQGHEGDPAGLADFLVSCNSVANTLAVGNHVCEKTDEFTTVRMKGKCALVSGLGEDGAFFRRSGVSLRYCQLRRLRSCQRSGSAGNLAVHKRSEGLRLL